MSYRYYGGTRGRSSEDILREVEWAKKHLSHEGWKKYADQTKRYTRAAKWVAIGIGFGLAVFGVGALCVWGLQNLFAGGFEFSLVGFILNPITLIVLFVGGALVACR